MDIATTGTKTETSAPAKADADRLALAEVQCRLGDVGRELAAMRDGTVFPAMAADRRAEQIRQLEADLARLQARHAELSRAVPEPDTVPGPDGSTPPQRRERHRELYLQQRPQRRADLQTKSRVPDRRRRGQGRAAGGAPQGARRSAADRGRPAGAGR